ncbi:unnamed protein product [Aspergillus oryzae]|uniref:Unnamed protein product n=1 Tax=Aspergillus oryzae TaxID=5062 RepID=A0AAN4YG72_ASPOZ|nr:unnamed protein product [Aspergillus oryzae]
MRMPWIFQPIDDADTNDKPEAAGPGIRGEPDASSTSPSPPFCTLSPSSGINPSKKCTDDWAREKRNDPS